MKKRIYTATDLEIMRSVYTEVYLDDNVIVLVKEVNNPTYKSTVRRDKITASRFIMNAKGIRLVCFKTVFAKVLSSSIRDPIEIMMRIHNYGVAAHKHITNEKLMLEVVDALLKVKKTRGQMLIAMQAGLM